MKRVRFACLRAAAPALLGAALHFGAPAGAAAAREDGLALKPARELSLQRDSRAPVAQAGTPEGSVLAPIRSLSGIAPTASDTPAVLLAVIAAFLATNILALLGFSLLARSLRERREARAARFRGRWEPVLYARMAGDKVPLPPLAHSERTLFIELWLHALGYVRDEAADELTAVARDLEMARHALELLEGRSRVGRLLATRMAAALRLEQAISALQRKVAQRRPRSSLEAAKALLKISPARGFASLNELLAHLEWSPGAMAGVVRTGGVGAARMLWTLLATLPPGGGKQVVRLIELLEDHEAVPALRERLRDNGDAEEIAVILHALGRLGGSPERAAVLGFLGHGHWLVRMQAAAALGALGLPGDEGRLEPMLRDPHWWVRYRAAQALSRLTGAGELRRLRVAQTDRYAGEILDRVLAEG